MKLTLAGGEAIERALRELGGKIAGRLGENAVRAGARVLLADAKRRAPVKTGALKKSLRVFRHVDRKTGERTVYVGTRLHYGRMAETGTARQPARPYLRPALDEGGPAATDATGKNLWRGIERETAKLRSK